MLHYEVKAPFKWRVCFFLVSLPAFGLGTFPWYKYFVSAHFPNVKATLILFVFTVLPLVLGSGSLLFSIRRVRFSVKDNQLFYTLRLLCFSRTKLLEFDKIRLQLAQFGSRRPRIWLAIYGCNNQSRWMLANEQTCDSVRQLFDWLDGFDAFNCEDASEDRFAG